jgi:hypothetical protein
MIINEYPGYEIFENGQIFSIKSSRFLKHLLSKSTGYFMVVLYNKDGSKRKTVHRLLAQHFIDNKGNKPQVNHINGIRTDNRIENLEWVTCSENLKHLWKIGSGKNTLAAVRKNSVKARAVAWEKNRKKVRDIYTNEVFGSLSEAAYVYNFCPSNLGKRLSGKLKNTTTLELI